VAALCLFFLSSAVAAFGQPDSLRIMPLGDSITEAQGGVSETQLGFASYRYWLWHELIDRGHPVDFVGSQYGVWNGPPPYTDYDQDHEGHWGWRADQILAEITGWVESARPDIVLIHLGHNDLWQGQSIASTIDDLGGIIDDIRGVNPRAILLLARVIPPALGVPDSLPELNDQIDILGVQMNTPESPVIVVDHETGFDPWIHTYDSVHPNELGEQFMAERWLAPLDSILTDLADVTPVPVPTGGRMELGNFPNPFNPATVITFSLPHRTRVRLGVYDVAGRRIRTLLDGQVLEAGSAQIVWQGRDDAGKVVGAGVYFTRLEIDDARETRRLTLIK